MMIYYMIRLKMKYNYYITHDMKKYNKLNHVSNKYKDEFGKPLAFERVLIAVSIPFMYPFGMFRHRQKKKHLLRKYKRYNRYFKEVLLDCWGTGVTTKSKYLKPKEIYKPK